jgi:hypothetical protein
MRRLTGGTAIERAGFLALVVGLPWLFALLVNRLHYSALLPHIWGTVLEALFIQDYFYGADGGEVAAARLSLLGLFARFAAEPLVRWLRTGNLRSQ